MLKISVSWETTSNASAGTFRCCNNDYSTNWVFSEHLYIIAALDLSLSFCRMRCALRAAVHHTIVQYNLVCLYDTVRRLQDGKYRASIFSLQHFTIDTGTNGAAVRSNFFVHQNTTLTCLELATSSNERLCWEVRSRVRPPFAAPWWRQKSEVHDWTRAIQQRKFAQALRVGVILTQPYDPTHWASHHVTVSILHCTQSHNTHRRIVTWKAKKIRPQRVSIPLSFLSPTDKFVEDGVRAVVMLK